MPCSLIEAICDDIRIDREMNRRLPSWKDKFRLLVVPQLSCLAIYRTSHTLWLKRFKVLAKILRNLNVILFGIDIQPEAEIEGGVFIGHAVGIVIGPHVKIGKGCIIFQGVTVTPGIRAGFDLTEKDRVSIGRDVQIYAGAKIIGNIEIGSNVTIGANAVVLRSIPDGATVAGIPASIVSTK